MIGKLASGVCVLTCLCLALSRDGGAQPDLRATVTTGPAGPGAATQPATRPTGSPTASLPAEPMPTVDQAQIHALLNKLDDRQYAVRQEARRELERLVDIPQVAEVLEARLKGDPTAEVRYVLETLLGPRSRPLAFVWCDSVIEAAGGSPRYLPGEWYPCLYVCGNGEFVCDRGSAFFTGKAGATPRSDVRGGTLTAEGIWTVAQAIKRSGVARLPVKQPQPAPNPKNSMIQLTLHVRAGDARRTSTEIWTLDSLARPAEAAPEIRLAVALRDLVAACPSQPYQGPYAAMVSDVAMKPEEVLKLPSWPQGTKVDMSAMFQTGGAPLDDEQLKAVREALAQADTYRLQNQMDRRAIKVRLIPYLGTAIKIRYRLEQ